MYAGEALLSVIRPLLITALAPTSVWDRVPIGTNPPFVQISQIEQNRSVRHNCKSGNYKDLDVQFDCYSIFGKDEGGKRTTARLADIITDQLVDVNLTVPGWRWVSCQELSILAPPALQDPEGYTQRTIVILRFELQKL